jgi:hypothetical protein
MRVALCFAGIPYFIRQNKHYWLELINKYNADVYASLWDEEGIYQPDDTIEYFKNTYNPVTLEVEDQKALLKSFRFLAEEYTESPEMFKKEPANHFAHVNARPYSTLYKTWRANLLPSLAGREYDVVIRAETCSSFPDMHIVQENNLSIPYWHHVYMKGNYQSINLNNWVAFGPPDIMDYYCSCFLKLRKYYDECLPQPIESFLNHHLFQRPNIMMRLFFSRIYRKGLLNWNGKKYPHDVESDVSSGCWYNFVRDLGVDDEKMNDGNMIKGNSFDTSIKEHKSRRELDLHVMEEGPINLPWPRERKENQEETGYHSVHKFNPLEKAQADSNCGKAEQDIHGNWVPIFTPT